jgi:DNA-binding MarR family transcriptional regulator
MAKNDKEIEPFEVNLKENDARVFLLFIQTAEATLKYSEAALNRAGLSLVKLMVLRLLEAHGGTLTPSVIARLTLREKHDITTLIRRMQKGELIKVSASTKDRRSIHITITDKGRQAITDTTPTALNVMKQAMSSIPDSSSNVLEETLRTLRQNVCSGLKQISEPS